MRALGGRKKTPAKPSKPVQKPAPQKKPQKKPIEVIIEDLLGDMGGKKEKGPQTTLSELDTLLTKAQPMLVRAQELKSLAETRTSTAARMPFVVEAICAAPLARIVRYLSEQRARGEIPDWNDIANIQSELAGMTGRLALLETTVEARIRPDTAESLRLLDIAAQECLVPFLNHANRFGLPHANALAVILVRSPDNDQAIALEGTSIAPVVLPKDGTAAPWTWIQIASDVYLDVFHSTRGLDRKVAQDLGVLPTPLSFGHYPDEQSFLWALIGGFVPGLFADTCAALLLGPGFAAGLSKWLQNEVSQERATVAIIDGTRTVAPPLHVRMFVACQCLNRLGFTNAAGSRWQDWTKRLNTPETLTIEMPDGEVGNVPIQPVLKMIARVIDYFLTEPLPQLGNTALSAIPMLTCNEIRADRMALVADKFLVADPVDEPGYVVIGAAQLASEKSTTLEQRIVAAAMRSLAGEGEYVRPAQHTPAPQDIKSLRAQFGSKTAWAQAIVAGAAVAPRSLPSKQIRRRVGKKYMQHAARP